MFGIFVKNANFYYRFGQIELHKTLKSLEARGVEMAARKKAKRKKVKRTTKRKAAKRRR